MYGKVAKTFNMEHLDIPVRSVEGSVCTKESPTTCSAVDLSTYCIVAFFSANRELLCGCSRLNACLILVEDINHLLQSFGVLLLIIETN